MTPLMRSYDQIRFHAKQVTTWHEKLALAIEAYISTRPENEQATARQQLPFLVQFGPCILKYWKDMPLLAWANPTIAHGGLTEYEKHAIYQHIPASVQITSTDILTETFPSASLITEAHQTHHIGFPCMLKSNQGERGVGIYFVSNAVQFEALLSKFTSGELTRTPSTLQSYCDWPEEWCLQFYQHPVHGMRIGSLVKRNMPTVTGDGTQTLLQLIEQLALSSFQKEKIIKTLHAEEPDRLMYIPNTGAVEQIIRKASIDFGTTYTDVTCSLTEAQQHQLIELLSYLTARLPLLSVGRFDLKARSLEGLLHGEVRVIECNAGGGIPTHVYDECCSIPAKYRILDEHFRTMKEIALYHKKNTETKKGSWRTRTFQLCKAIYTSLKKKGVVGQPKKSTLRAHTESVYIHVRKEFRRL